MGGAELPLDFDAWAALCARMVRRGEDERRAILAEQGVEPEVWRRCDEHHAATLAHDAAEGEGTLAKRYGALCAAEMQRRRSALSAPAPEPQSAPPPAPVAEPAPESPPQEEIPSFLREVSISVPVMVVPPSLAMTQDVSAAVRAATAPALPFAGKLSPASVATAPASPRAASAAPAPGTPPGMTLEVGTDLRAFMRPALPFAATPGERGTASPRLTFQAYASLCAELALHPEEAEAILRKYNITNEAARRALDEEWQARFSAHPDTQAQWRALVISYREYLLRKRA